MKILHHSKILDNHHSNISEEFINHKSNKFSKKMKAIISNFRLGKTTKYTNHMIIKIDTIMSKSQAEKFINKTIIWTSPSKKQIKGKIVAAHGNSGAVRVIFEKGMPGQSISNEVEISK